MKFSRYFAATVMLALAPAIARAQETEVLDPETASRLLSLRYVGIACIIIAVLVLLSFVIQKKSELVKRLLFWGMTITVIATTLFLAVSTISLNLKSWSHGPIHWHADFEVWACDQELDLIDPKGLSNKIGSPSRHEHNDKRLHYEGVVVEPQDASLASFFTVIGGQLTNKRLVFPSTNGVVAYDNGDSCSEGTSGGMVNTFVYSVNDDNTFSQRKITAPETYIIRDESQVPPGDCIIVEFGVDKQTTDKLCRSYKVAQEIGKLKQEVPYGN